MRVVECERAREYSSARGLACNAREYYTITTRVTCESLASHSRVSRESLASLSRVTRESLASHSRVSRESLASDTRVPFNLLVDSTVDECRTLWGEPERVHAGAACVNVHGAVACACHQNVSLTES